MMPRVCLLARFREADLVTRRETEGGSIARLVVSPSFSLFLSEYTSDRHFDNNYLLATCRVSRPIDNALTINSEKSSRLAWYRFRALAASPIGLEG